VVSLTQVDWQLEAKCVELPIRKSDAMFFPSAGGSSSGGARFVCQGARCESSLEYALQNQEQHGI
jgi:hypothetical protein